MQCKWCKQFTDRQTVRNGLEPLVLSFLKGNLDNYSQLTRYRGLELPFGSNTTCGGSAPLKQLSPCISSWISMLRGKFYYYLLYLLYFWFSICYTEMYDNNFRFLRNKGFSQMGHSTEIQSSCLMSMSVFNFSVHLWIHYNLCCIWLLIFHIL